MLWNDFMQGCRNPGGIYPPNNLTVSLPIVWEWSTSASTPIIWLLCASERRCPLEFGEKSVPFLMKTFLFALHLLCSPEENRGRGSSPPMLKIEQNWGKIANYPPNAQQRSAPLISCKFCINWFSILEVLLLFFLINCLQCNNKKLGIINNSWLLEGIRS